MLTPVTQEYEMIIEEGTRAEQLAKQQKNLKQRYKGNFVMLSIHHGIAGAYLSCRDVILLPARCSSRAHFCCTGWD